MLECIARALSDSCPVRVEGCEGENWPLLAPLDELKDLLLPNCWKKSFARCIACEAYKVNQINVIEGHFTPKHLVHLDQNIPVFDKKSIKSSKSFFSEQTCTLL